MKPVLKILIPIPVILLGLFSHSLYAFKCQTVTPAITWNLGDVTISEVSGMHVSLPDLPDQQIATNCTLEDIDSYRISYTMDLQLMRKNPKNSYKLSNNLEITDLSSSLFSYANSGGELIPKLESTLPPDTESPDLFPSRTIAAYSVNFKGSFAYYPFQGPIRTGPFNEKIGDYKLKYGPTIPIYVLGNLIVAPVCSVVNMNTVVNMPEVNTTDFNGINSTAGAEMPISIDLKCDSATPTLNIHLDESDSDNPMQGIVKPTLDSTTKGIAIQLLNKDGSPANFNNDIISSPAADNHHKISLLARYIQTGKRVSTGKLSANISFDMVYE